MVKNGIRQQAVDERIDGTTSTRPQPQRKRMTREQLTPLARDTLFRAAAKVVSEVGYAEASVARITAEANVAQGTFYLYFNTRQSLFDELLSYSRVAMLDHIRDEVMGANNFFDMEERGMAAFLKYLRDRPGFLRILNEAEAVASEAWHAHYDDVAERYRRALTQAISLGEVRELDAAELDTVIYLIMGSRVALWQRCQGLPSRQFNVAVSHYMRMVRVWLSPQLDHKTVTPGET